MRIEPELFPLVILSENAPKQIKKLDIIMLKIFSTFFYYYYGEKFIDKKSLHHFTLRKEWAVPVHFGQIVCRETKKSTLKKTAGSAFHPLNVVLL